MFLLDDSNIATIYTIPFFVGLAMPGRRSITAVGAGALVIAALATASSDGSFAAAFGLFFILTAIGGLCCGLVARAATLRVAPWSRRPFLFIAIAVLGYSLPPIVYSGPAETMAWLRRPSQSVCAAATYRMTMANRTLQIRAAPVFAVQELRRPDSTYLDYLSFDSEWGLKQICGRGLRDRQVIGPVAVNLYPSNLQSALMPGWVAATCAAPPDETLRLVCLLKDGGQPAHSLQSATIYGPEMDAAMATSDGYAVEKRLRERVAEAKQQHVSACEGDEASNFERALLCGVHDVTASGIRIKFLYRTNGARRAQDAEAIQAYLRDLIASFSPGNG